MKFLAVLLALFGITFGQVCDDSYECEGDTISGTYGYCYGYYGCDEADLTVTYLLAYGAMGAYYSDSTSTYAYAYGFRSLLYASAATQYLYAYGFYSAYLADIEPKTSYLYAYLYGYYSGYYADISCYSGDYCYLYCGTGNGCYYTKYYCYSQAQCYYHCDSADYCPTLYSGVESTVTFEGETKGETYDGLSDNEIKAKHSINKRIKKKMLKQSKDDDVELEGESDEARKARILALDNHSSVVNGVGFGNSMIFGGAAIGSVCFIFGVLVSKCFKANNGGVYEKLLN